MSRNLNSEKCCYPRDVNIPSPVNFYKTIRILFLVACACLCIASPDLCQGILLFLLAFSNFSNMWNFQIWFSSIVSVVKIAINLTLPVSVYSSIIFFPSHFTFQTTTTHTLFNLFGLYGGIVEGDEIKAVNVVNIYSVLNGVIMILAGFNYLTLRYQQALNTE